MKWQLSLKTTTNTAISSRPMMKFETRYTVETVFDGSKLGIEPYTVEVLSSGNLLVLDFANSNLYKISSSLSQWAVTKVLSFSSIEISTQIHEFYLGDSSHINSKDIYHVLGMLYEEMKMESCILKVNLVQWQGVETCDNHLLTF